MTFKFDCPHCGQRISADSTDAGSEGACPTCHSAIEVPSTAGAARSDIGEPLSFPEQKQQPQSPRKPTATPPPLALSPSWKSIWPLALLIGLLGWAPALMMHEVRSLVASSAGAYILTGICASLAATAFFCKWLRPRTIPTVIALSVFVATAVGGVFLLIAFQRLSLQMAERGVMFTGKGTILIWIVQFAGKCWEWAFRSKDLLKQLVGFIFGVGIYEELTKILPLAVVLYIGREKPLSERISYRAFVALGFVSGLAFGVSEALVEYNPWAPQFRSSGFSFTDGALRWFSVVPIHAVWGAADAAVLWLVSPEFFSTRSSSTRFALLVLATFTMAIVHGTYDVIVGRNQFAGAALSIGSVFLMQCIVAYNAASAESVRVGFQNPKVSESFLERLLRASSFVPAGGVIAVAGFGTLYWVSSPSNRLPTAATKTHRVVAEKSVSKRGRDVGFTAADQYRADNEYYERELRKKKDSQDRAFEMIMESRMRQKSQEIPGLGD